MLKGNRFLAMVGVAAMLSIVLAGLLSAFLVTRTLLHPPPARSGLASATLVRAGRMWRSGQQIEAVQQFAQGYFMVAESTVRFPLARYYARRSTEYLNQGSYQEALDWWSSPCHWPLRHGDGHQLRLPRHSHEGTALPVFHG